MPMKYRALIWIEVDAADRVNAEAAALALLKSKKVEGKLSAIEEA
jgi:hypothetical protein